MTKTEFGNLQDKRQKQGPRYILGDLVRTADTKRLFRKGDSINWSYNLITMTQKFHNTIASFRTNYSPDKYNEHLLRPIKFTLDGNNHAMKKLKLFQ